MPVSSSTGGGFYRCGGVPNSHHPFLIINFPHSQIHCASQADVFCLIGGYRNAPKHTVAVHVKTLNVSANHCPTDARHPVDPSAAFHHPPPTTHQ